MRKIERGNKDPAKMTLTILAPVKRGLGAKRASEPKNTVSEVENSALMVMPWCAHDAREGMKVEGSMPQAQNSRCLRDRVHSLPVQA